MVRKASPFILRGPMVSSIHLELAQILDVAAWLVGHIRVFRFRLVLRRWVALLWAGFHGHLSCAGMQSKR
jgi:hypothetical protein